MATPLEQLEAMRTVPENWDGYGGLSPSSEAIDAATAFYQLLGDTPGLSTPYLSPTPNGGVQFDWDVGSHHMEVAFEPKADGRIVVEFLYDNAETGDVVSGTAENARSLSHLPYPLRQLVTGFVPAAA